MSPTPQAPEEEPNFLGPLTQQALNERLELFERGFKSRLEPTIKEIAQRVADSAIREFKRELETAQRDQREAESRKSLDRWTEWSKRWVCALAGFVLCLFFGIIAQQCSELHNRITNLELKK
jgi:hypothetical protein